MSNPEDEPILDAEHVFNRPRWLREYIDVRTDR